MTAPKSEWIWHDGSWVRWEDALVHVTAHALHYGSSVFEGIRAYETGEGPATFRLEAEIGSDSSPVGIDAKKTHVLILFKLQQIEKRLASIEARLAEEENSLSP